MKLDRNRALGASSLIGSALFFGKEFIIWGWGKVLDYLTDIFKNFGLNSDYLRTISISNVTAVALLVCGFYFILSSFRPERRSSGTTKLMTSYAPSKIWDKERSDRRNATVVSLNQIENGVAVTYIDIDLSRVEQELIIEVVIQTINATSEDLILYGVEGFISYSIQIMAIKTDPVSLDTPLVRLINHEGNTVPSFSSGVFAVEQKINRSTAATMFKSLSSDSRGTVIFDLEHLSIIVGSSKKPEKKWRLPIWDGVGFSASNPGPGITFYISRIVKP